MLAELSIKNFAIIESLTVSFEKGLTVLTGETGAGKSIIIDAIFLLAGGRGSSEFVRHGEQKAELEGLFLLDNEQHQCIDKCEQFGIEVLDGMIVMQRHISSNGKSVCRINGKLVTISILREVGSHLIDIHGQHDNQVLMNQEKHLSLLDQFCHEEISPALIAYQELYEKYASFKKKMLSLSENEQEMVHRLDLIQFQLNEIENAQLQPQEDERLEEELNKLSNFESVYKKLTVSYEALQGEQRGLDWIGLAMNHLEEVSQISEELKTMYEQMSNSYYLIEELTFQMRNELDQLEFDPKKLDEIQSRLNEISQLKRKYGHTVEEILSYASVIEEEIDTILNRENHLSKLDDELKSISDDLRVEANNLTVLRKKFADQLRKQIHQELKELYMEKTQFYIEFITRKEHFKEYGVDDIAFYLSPNPGESAKPLSKIASGGELSRIMLAMKSIFSIHQEVTSIIFDEVDTGVSGRVAQAIAEKIYKVSSSSQVICITHLPQVAAMADTHLLISKSIHNNRTTTNVEPLPNQKKVAEIARMLAGAEITNLSKQHAKELLDMAKSIKYTTLS
ncbi:DNA repair protein RecN [Bacillus carboniphilus]|uniref:DNA repair protein RecN n=1 Tax=Bacillus carboniphilus TaxID=86663 RepID=A0ABY9K0P2_9BACI|nr:DNA repair protein RecN [Bacillus carboniphilus]WLR44278.1 DNA repair protein RecN [Bacillus carboniphilus]